VKIDPAQTRMVAELKHTAPLLGCRCDPSGKYIFAGGQDNAVQRWDIASGKKTTLTGHESWIRAIAFAANEKLAITADYHGKLLFWPVDAEAPKPVKSIEAHDGWVRWMTVSPDGKRLATAGNDGVVKLWSLPDCKPIASLSGHGCHVYAAVFAPDGTVASCDLKGVVKVWDVARGAATREMDAKILYKYDTGFMADIGGARGMAYSPDGKYLACSGITDVSNAFAGVGNPLVVVFDAATGQRKHLLRPKEAFQGTAWGVGFHPAGFAIAVGGGNGGALWFWSLDKGENVFTLKFPNNGRDLALHPDGKRLAVPFADGAVRVYDMSPKLDAVAEKKPLPK
jgi:WD40 repeat protein